MDNRVYIWLFNNINRYNFVGAEALEIKNSISRMLITEDSLNSEDMMNKMRIEYEKFVRLFYNNIYGYRNGFASKAITAEYLDCYFINTSEGFVPVGYYKSVRPAESVMVVQKYLEQAKNDIKNEKNQLVSIWQNKINEISSKFDRIKNRKNPSVVKAVFGGIAAFLLLAFVIFSFINLDVIGVLLSGGNPLYIDYVLYNIPLISNGGFAAWAIYLLFTFAALAIAVLDIIFTIKEIRLLCAKNATKNLLENILPSVTRLEQNIQFELQQGDDGLLTAVMQGKDIHIGRNSSAYMVADIDNRIRKGAEFTNKTNRQRKGIGLALIIISFVIVLIGALTYIIRPLFPDIPAIHIDDPTEAPTEEPTEEPKTSTYSAIKYDTTWLEANSSALNSGGYLVSINDEEEFDEVCALAEREGLYVFWAGASKNAYEDWGDVTWEDGTEFSYRPWLPGEPSEYSEDGDREDYLMVFKVDGKWYFNDSENDAIAASPNYEGKIGFIIEYEE